MINISPTITVLLERMDTNPDEFAHHLRHMTSNTFSEIVYGSRWSSITESILEQNDRYKVFTAEEVNAYRDKLAGLFRKRLEEDVCQELLNPHKEPEQMELFPNQSSFPPRGRTGAVTAQQITTEALKILNGEIGKNRTKEIMDDPTGHIL
jgi:hypothetical protein